MAGLFSGGNTGAASVHWLASKKPSAMMVGTKLFNNFVLCLNENLQIFHNGISKLILLKLQSVYDELYV